MSVLIECDIGDTVVVTGTMTDLNDQPVPGATVTARALHGTSAAIPLSPVTDQGGGLYSVEFTPTIAGQWHIRFDCAQQPTVAEEGIVSVRRTRFTT